MSTSRLSPLLPLAALHRLKRPALPVVLVSSVGATHTPVASRSARHGTPLSCGLVGGRTARWARRLRHVRFVSPSASCVHDVTPYEECYGMHPSLFNFDASGDMVPPSPADGYSPLELPPQSPRVFVGAALLSAAKQGSPGAKAADGTQEHESPCSSHRSSSAGSPSTLSRWAAVTPHGLSAQSPWASRQAGFAMESGGTIE